MALWQTFKIVCDPSLAGFKGFTAVPPIISIVNSSTHVGSQNTLRGDEKIKWQWAVRCRPTSDCPHSCVPKTKCIKRQGWIAWLLRKKPEEIIVDMENCPPRKPESHPKIWQLEYYSYLLPDSYLKPKPSLETCRLHILEIQREELDRNSLECLNRDTELDITKTEEQIEFLRDEIKNKKIIEPQPCPPPLPKEPRDLVVKNCKNMGTCVKNKKPASMDEFDVGLPYEDKPLKVTTTHPKQYKFKSKTKTQWTSFPPISQEEVKLLCRLDYKNAQFKYVECPKSMYTRFKNVSEDENLQPVSCKCTLRPVDTTSTPGKNKEEPCESSGSFWGKNTKVDDTFKCQHPLEKRI